MLMKIIDMILAPVIFVVSLPLMVVALLLVYLEDHKNPIYVSIRVGKDGRSFRMYKIRSMMSGVNGVTVDSTSNNDSRITKIGKYLRKYKIDELPQLVNVMKGEMSLVGPRPNVLREVNLYTVKERFLLKVKPGMTDISSIIFADLGTILENELDPDIAYNQLVRPWKGMYGLFYVANNRAAVDFTILCITAMALVSRHHSLMMTHRLLKLLKAPKELLDMSLRDRPLDPLPPVGSDKIVCERKI